MNKHQMKKLERMKKSEVKQMRLAVEIAFVRRAQAMKLGDRIKMAWLILQGAGRGKHGAD